MNSTRSLFPNEYPLSVIVSVPVFPKDLNGDGKKIDLQRIADVYKEVYTGRLVRFEESCDEGGFLSAAAMTGRDDMQISIAGNEERLILTARFDNLGKGASGAAIQNMNILLGLPEETGLIL